MKCCLDFEVLEVGLYSTDDSNICDDMTQGNGDEKSCSRAVDKTDRTGADDKSITCEVILDE